MIELNVEAGKYQKNQFTKPLPIIVYKTKQMLIPVTVLQLITEDGSYQFGFNPWAKPVDHLGIEIEEQFVTLKFSFFSTFIRVAILAYIGYWGWLEFIKT